MKLLILFVLTTTALADRCSIPCTEPNKPLCGSDGRTYPNECSLRIEACKRKQVIVVLYRSECQKNRDGTFCRRFCNRRGFFHCGSDGKSHGNTCTRIAAGCKAGRPITFVQMTGGFRGKRRDCSKCNLQCLEQPMKNEPVCAQDGRTYANECAMRLESCKGRKPMMVVYKGACKK